MTFAEKIIQFNRNLKFEQPLPPGIRVMNPYAENPQALEVSSLFYRRFYDDDHPRRLILGINPGRFGAGVTGVPFTDTQRLKEYCGLEIRNVETRELSSVFVYEMINAYGGTEKFYGDFFISAVSPLGFVRANGKGGEINYNYYDSRDLLEAVEPFIIQSIEEQLTFGIKTDTCYCLGNNKNYKYLLSLNRTKNYFEQVIPLEHPRYIMQYKLKQKYEYIRKFTERLQR